MDVGVVQIHATSMSTSQHHALHSKDRGLHSPPKCWYPKTPHDITTHKTMTLIFITVKNLKSHNSGVTFNITGSHTEILQSRPNIIYTCKKRIQTTW